MVRKFFLFGFMALLVSSCGSKGGSSRLDKSIEEGKPLVQVGDEKIHEGYLDLLQRINPGLKSQMDIPMGRKRLVDNLVEQELLYQESLKRGLEKNPQVKEKVALYRRVIVAQSLLDDEVEKKAKDYYDQNKEKEFERVKIAHIFFSGMPKIEPPMPGKPPPPPPSEAEKKKAEDAAGAKAKEAYDRLKKGESWDSVVTAMSDDKVSASRGGEMGYISRGDRRAERLEYQGIIDAAFSLAKGAFSEPIKAKDGWHIIQVIEEKKVQPYDEVAMAIKFKVRGEAKNSLLADLKKKMKVEYLDASLAEPTSEASPIPPPPPPPSETKSTETKPTETKPVK
jgi:peptidyl-prolyl cis-trans isomerase C